MTDWGAAELTTALLRIVLLMALIGFYIVFVELPRRWHIKKPGSANETISLLTVGIDGNDHAKGVPPAWTRPTSAPTRSWWEYIKGYYLFFHYLCPSKDRKLQAVFVLCLCLVLVQRVVNLLVPGQMGHIVDRLGGKKSGSPWTAIIIFISLRFL
jgi:hypothetical protein